MAAIEQEVSDALCEVAVVGAGPSGLAAAALLREHGVGVTVIDEQPRAGGQILRQPPKSFSVAHWLPGELYDRVKAALSAVDDRQDIDWRFQSTVLGIMRPSPYRTARAVHRTEAALTSSNIINDADIAGPERIATSGSGNLDDSGVAGWEISGASYRRGVGAADLERAATSGSGNLDDSDVAGSEIGGARYSDGVDVAGREPAVANSSCSTDRSEASGSELGGAGDVYGAAVGRSGWNRSGGFGHELWIQGPAGAYCLRAKAVLLATGCYERPLAFTGWTLPGVMGAGAIQGFVKSQQFVPGKRFLLAGSHPLQLIVADQLLNAGAEIAAVVFTQRKQQALRMLRHPLVALRHHRQLLETFHVLNRLRRAGVRVIFGHAIVRAEGAAAVERATIAAVDANGAIDQNRTEVFECDRIGICHGFLASSELARQAGAEMHWKDHAGGWLARHDEWFESSLENVFVAGEITSVEGADAALEKGRIAAAGILRSLGRVNDSQANHLVERARIRLSHLQSFAAILQGFARPPEGLALQTMSEETIVCRCESIKCGELRQALAENKHILSADAAKLLTRVGMGLCQGRLCNDNVARVIAEARGLQPEEIGPFQAQFPVKPVPLATLGRGRGG